MGGYKEVLKMINKEDVIVLLAIALLGILCWVNGYQSGNTYGWKECNEYCKESMHEIENECIELLKKKEKN